MRLTRSLGLAASVLLLAGCAAAPSTPGYGPLSFNVSGGGDFYFAQNGSFVPARLSDGTIEVDLKPTAFQIGYNGEQLNICLAQTAGPEIKTDPQGYKASCLAGPMSGAHAADDLLVYSGKVWSDGNTEFSDNVSKKAVPLSGYSHAYEVDEMTFVAAPDLSLQNFRGALYGYIVVYKQHERMNRDIMPIRLVFE